MTLDHCAGVWSVDVLSVANRRDEIFGAAEPNLDMSASGTSQQDPYAGRELTVNLGLIHQLRKLQSVFAEQQVARI